MKYKHQQTFAKIVSIILNLIAIGLFIFLYHYFGITEVVSWATVATFIMAEFITYFGAIAVVLAVMAIGLIGAAWMDYLDRKKQ